MSYLLFEVMRGSTFAVLSNITFHIQTFQLKLFAFLLKKKSWYL